VLIAGGANVVVAILKLAAGLIAGSSAMLAESAHSLADTINQGLLLTSLRLGERPGDQEHPFGYGQDRYFWSLLSAFGIFIAGAGFSVFEGILALHRPAGEGSQLLAYIVLAVSFAAEGTSFLRAYRQTRGRARNSQTSVLEEVRESPDTTVRTALFEDSAAMIGLLLALAGLILRQITGSGVYDGAASIAIGALLVLVAVRLGRDSRDLLIGRAASDDQLRTIRAEIEGTPGVDALVELLTMHLGPDRLIVGARVDLSDDISADQAEQIADRIDSQLIAKLPVMPHVFVDPTSRSGSTYTPGDGGRRRAI
jgi:cation diffusion facilitator family transporter